MRRLFQDIRAPVAFWRCVQLLWGESYGGMVESEYKEEMEEEKAKKVSGIARRARSQT